MRHRCRPMCTSQSYVPQSLLLPHCSAVICHGGAGTGSTRWRSACRSLMLPQGADQYVISELVALGRCSAGRWRQPMSARPAVRAGVLASLENLPSGQLRAACKPRSRRCPVPSRRCALIEEAQRR